MNYKTYRGDSLDLDSQSPFFWDHVVRYWWAAEQAKQLSVLDCATGKGYGAFIMAQTANKVTGIDLNPHSIHIAQTSFSSQTNLIYKLQDVFKLEELGEKFDLITAFEVIEHLPPELTDKFISSLAGALKPNGTLLLSTPNHDVVMKSYVHLPSFHINNFRPKELKSALSKHFNHVEMLGQFKERKGLQKLIFDFDFLNLRHILKNLFKSKPKHNPDHPDESEDSHDVIQGQKLSADNFSQKPVAEIAKYKFSSSHFRQAGLTVARCSHD